MTNTAETEELIKGLRRNELFGDDFAGRAAAAFSSLLDENARLREAIQPFAELTDSPDDHDQEGYILRTGPMGMTVDITAGDIRRARAALHGDPHLVHPHPRQDGQQCDHPIAEDA